MSSPQAGWYQDPQDPQGLRYWDGVQWTSQTHQPNPPAAPSLGSYQAPPQAPGVPAYQGYGAAQQGSYAAEPVSFTDAAKGLITKWTFRGRASRSEYWFSSLTLSLLIFILRAVAGVVGVEAVGYVALLVQAVLGINLLLIAIRRYHDTGRSGWWLLLQVGLHTVLVIALIVTLLAALLSGIGGATSGTQSFGAAALVVLVLFLANLIWLIVWLCLSGKPEKNRFDN
jgi:uncharacterized membrane protein YhaH (DUF805 family)